LLPIDNFKVKVDGKTKHVTIEQWPIKPNKLPPIKKGQDFQTENAKLPFQSIDLIFNHKNIWANLQN